MPLTSSTIMQSNTRSFSKYQPSVSRHPRFFFPDGTVIYLVENVLYKIHRYFFQRDSAIFDAMFSLPPPSGKQPEGQDEEDPIVLEGVEARDFDRLLVLLYPYDFVDHELQKLEDWISVLKLSTQWDLTGLRRLAITKIPRFALAPVDRVALGDQYDVSAWLESGYTEFCVRREPLSLEEGRKMGVDIAVTIEQVRHMIRFPSNLRRDAIEIDVTPSLDSVYTEYCVRHKPLTLEEGRRIGVDVAVIIAKVRQDIRHYHSSLNRDPGEIGRVIRHVFRIHSTM